jgi:hypothetical protein
LNRLHHEKLQFRSGYRAPGSLTTLCQVDPPRVRVRA